MFINYNTMINWKKKYIFKNSFSNNTFYLINKYYKIGYPR